MSTVTHKSLPDPDDDSIEPSVRRFEDKLRRYSPIVLGVVTDFTSITFPAIYGLTTILGYLLFLIPSIVLATVVTDVVSGTAIFTTLTSLSSIVPIVTSAVLANTMFVLLPIVVLYGVLIINYNPPRVNSSSVREPYEWQRLQKAVLVCTPLFVGGVLATYFTALPYTAILAVVASWWVLRRLTYTIVWDETRYMVDPAYTEWLLVSRLPWMVGVYLFITGNLLLGAFALFTFPFVVAGGYFYWRRTQGSDTTQNLSSVRMVERSGVPEQKARDYGPSAYSVQANHELLTEAVRKFNNFLETEIDTERRLEIPENPSKDEIRQVMAEANDLYNKFSEVSYRPDRFEDLKDQIDTYGMQELDAIHTGETRY